MPVYLILDAEYDLPQSLLKFLLNRPNTTIIAAVRQKLTPHRRASLQALPKHASSVVIPAKLDLRSEMDASGVVRALVLGGVTRIDVVALDVSTAADTTAAHGDRGYIDSVVRLLQHTQTLLADEARFIISGSGSAELEKLTEQVVDLVTLGTDCNGAIPDVLVDHGWERFMSRQEREKDQEHIPIGD